MKFKIYASMNVDSLESWIWTNCSKVCTNGFIIVANPENGKKIKCFKRTIDEKFVKIYNREGEGRISLNIQDHVIVMNEYYRKKLQINTKQEYELSISKAKVFSGLVLNWDHPNPQVQHSNRMGLLSILLGLIALALAINDILIHN